MHIELCQGSRKWYWRLVAHNGQIVATSQQYFSKWNAKRAAVKLAGINGWELRQVQS